MKCRKLDKAFSIALLIILLGLPTNASEEIKRINSGQPASYSGVLIPENAFYEYEACQADRDVCINMLDKVSQPINLSIIKASTYLKLGLGLVSFGLCTVFAYDGKQNGLGAVSGCFFASSVLTAAYIFD